MSVDFESGRFGAVVALYSIFHLPREEHGALFRRVWRWLGPGGLLQCTLSHRNEDAYTEEVFFGVTMYWSNYGLAENLETLSEVGFEVSSTSRGWADEVEAE